MESGEDLVKNRLNLGNNITNLHGIELTQVDDSHSYHALPHPCICRILLARFKLRADFGYWATTRALCLNGAIAGLFSL